MEGQPGYHSRLLEGKTDCLFSESQVLGTVTSVAKLDGKLNAERLLQAANFEQTWEIEQSILSAAPHLDAVQFLGDVLDCTGISKINQCLATAALQAMNNHEPPHKPIVLLAPSSSLAQWIRAIQDHWP